MHIKVSQSSCIDVSVLKRPSSTLVCRCACVEDFLDMFDACASALHTCPAAAFEVRGVNMTDTLLQLGQ